MLPPRLIFLKSPSPSALEDKYTRYVTSQGGPPPQFIPPLTSSIVSSAVTTLRNSLSSYAGFTSAYSGLILTSQRSVEALSLALAAFSSEEAPHGAACPLFVVGPATGSAAATSISARNFPARILGAGSGTGAALASYILDHYAAAPPQKPLLYLVGETHDSGFAATLRAGEVPVEELVVYATRERAEFGAELRQAVIGAANEVNPGEEESLGDKASHGKDSYQASRPYNPVDSTDPPIDQEGEQWLVACAPSGIAAMLKALGWVEDGDGNGDRNNEGQPEGIPEKRQEGVEEDGEHERRRPRYDAHRRAQCPHHPRIKVKVAAIGPKTEQVARAMFGFEVDAVAPAPTPEGVWRAVTGSSGMDENEVGNGGRT